MYLTGDTRLPSFHGLFPVFTRDNQFSIPDPGRRKEMEPLRVLTQIPQLPLPLPLPPATTETNTGNHLNRKKSEPIKGLRNTTGEMHLCKLLCETQPKRAVGITQTTSPHQMTPGATTSHRNKKKNFPFLPSTVTKKWWAGEDLNHRPPPRKGGILPCWTTGPR